MRFGKFKSPTIPFSGPFNGCLFLSKSVKLSSAYAVKQPSRGIAFCMSFAIVQKPGNAHTATTNVAVPSQHEVHGSDSPAFSKTKC